MNAGENSGLESKSSNSDNLIFDWQFLIGSCELFCMSRILLNTKKKKKFYSLYSLCESGKNKRAFLALESNQKRGMEMYFKDP